MFFLNETHTHQDSLRSCLVLFTQKLQHDEKKTFFLHQKLAELFHPDTYSDAQENEMNAAKWKRERVNVNSDFRFKQFTIFLKIK